jgi:metal-responsive CopG/Arc/MetJ family transcriptional regulator
VRLPKQTIAALDKWAKAKAKAHGTRSEAIRQLVERALAAEKPE